ncbi:hypothetical protein KC717_03610 [Candidatus Dojkabacteria bacterium]|uniref:7 transmembrane helices usually fused to an inactive transglutaminase domain-containing protein n=1 Tax=Candidatus Dojkabacteria bacterium TaxID=2099670 RepID=A0A955L8Q9_9BACT|nr:hypothetical protein [Candidatus Dojkabacteria bacterium]
MFHPIVEYLLAGGIHKTTIIAILSIPLIHLIINIGRYIIGFKIQVGYSIIIMVYLFYFLGTLLDPYQTTSNIFVGLRYGFIFISAITLFSISIYQIFKKVVMHYYPKLSVVIGATTIITTSLIFIGRMLEDPILTSINPIIIICIAILSEQITILYIKNGSSIGSVFEYFWTIILAGIAYIFLALPIFEDIFLQYPWLILIVLLSNGLIGKYTGLRITEYSRFNDLLLEKEHDEHISDTEE